MYLDMNPSWLKTVKDAIPIPGPLVLIFAGLGCYFLTCFVTQRPLTWGWALLPGLLLSLVIESWEVWDHYAISGLAGSSLFGIVGRHLKDVALMNALPVAIFSVATWLGGHGS